MLKKLGIVALALVLLGPSLGLIGVGLVMNPAASATCTVTGTNVNADDATHATHHPQRAVCRHDLGLVLAALAITARRS